MIVQYMYLHSVSHDRGLLVLGLIPRLMPYSINNQGNKVTLNVDMTAVHYGGVLTGSYNAHNLFGKWTV